MLKTSFFETHKREQVGSDKEHPLIFTNAIFTNAIFTTSPAVSKEDCNTYGPGEPIASHATLKKHDGTKMGHEDC